MWHRLRFFVVDAWDEWRHSPGVNLLALLTLSAALFLAGLITLILGNVAANVERLRADVRVEVYLDDELSEADRRSIQGELTSTAGVARVDYVDKDEALRRYRGWAGSMTGLLEELDTNPLPASMEVYLEEGPQAERIGGEIAAGLRGRAGIEEARFDRDWLIRLEALLDLARIGGGALAILIFGAVVFVMASVLRLAVLARQTEIDIMLLVGATPAFVRGPFLVAGLVQGLVSTSLALALVESSRRAALAYAGSGAGALLELVAARPMPSAEVGLLVLVGMLVSLAGSYFAVRRSF